MIIRIRKRMAQSLLEYAILLAVLIAAFMLLQAIIKRGFSGSVKEASERMGRQWSPSNTTSEQERVPTADLVTIEETGTEAAGALSDILPLVGGGGITVVGATDNDAYSYTARVGHEFTSTTHEQTDRAIDEEMRSGEYGGHDGAYDDFAPAF
ncbi:hypothetical protein ACFL38_01985 [Candidatus Omnitrophota bacterium]